MPRRELLHRITARLAHRFSYRANVRRLAFSLDRYSRSLVDAPYRERQETGPVNLAVKLERQRLGGPFEVPQIMVINRAATTLVGERRRILEVGSGTGLFAWLASEDQRRGLTKVAPSALLSTPNKWSDPFRSVARTPLYDEHVREWSAGELFWVLRAFYADVQLFTLADFERQTRALEHDQSYNPQLTLCSDLSCEEPMLAFCQH